MKVKFIKLFFQFISQDSFPPSPRCSPAGARSTTGPKYLQPPTKGANQDTCLTASYNGLQTLSLDCTSLFTGWQNKNLGHFCDFVFQLFFTHVLLLSIVSEGSFLFLGVRISFLSSISVLWRWKQIFL